MQVVIDIPEEVYRAYKMDVTLSFLNEDQRSIASWYLRSGLVDGIPLPKGHGRLGDLDALEKEMVNGIKAGNYEEGYETFAHINDMDDCIECVKYADTIIEADRSEYE